MFSSFKWLAFLTFTISSVVANTNGHASQQLPSQESNSANQVGNEAGQLSGQLASAKNALNNATAGSAGGGPIGAGGISHGPGGTRGSRGFPMIRYICQKHKQNVANLRSSPLGKLVQGIKKPLSQLTGGIVPAQSHPNEVELAAPGPQGGAAKIKKDQLQAPKRLAAIQELAKVDCHWYPEAQHHLVTALRTDRDECVRFEAAKILSNCKCSSDLVIHALRICVAGTSADGNPAERSLRIRNQAALALECCLSNRHQPSDQDAPDLRPEYPLPPNAVAPGEISADSSTRNRNSSVTQTSFIQGGQSKASKNPRAVKPYDSQAELRNAKLVLEQFRKMQNRRLQKNPPSSVQDAWTRSR